MNRPTPGSFLRHLAGVALTAFAWALFGPIAALAAAWLLWSPDPVAETGRVGGAGAVGAGAHAAGAHLANEWRRGGPARAHRRSARRTRWDKAGGARRKALQAEHAAVLVWRAGRSLIQATDIGVRAMPDGARHAIAASKHRAPRDAPAPFPPTRPAPTRPASPTPDQATGPHTGAPRPSTTAGPDSRTSPGPASPPNPGSQPAAGPARPQEQPPGGQMTDQTIADPTAGQGAGPGIAELATTADLRFEIGQVLGWIERAEVLAAQLKQWRDGVPERYEAAAAIGGPQTRGLTEAISELLEAHGDATVMREALNALRRACDQADALGEQADSMGATGHTRGYVTA